jgi:hypothetical protein
MESRKNKDKGSGSNLLGLLVAGAVGAIGGYFFNKLSKEAEYIISILGLMLLERRKKLKKIHLQIIMVQSMHQ